MGRRADDGKRDGWIQRFRRRETSGLGTAHSPATNFTTQTTSSDCGLFPSLQILRSLLPSNNLHPLNFPLRFLPRSFLLGAAGFRVDSVAAELQSPLPRTATST
jgi:hypothetical protein